MSQTSQVEQFGKYILLEKLAMGGMAEVYLAKSTGANGVNKFLAIKRILPQYSENEEFIDMFKEEAKIAVNLNHSNVVSIFDFGIEEKAFYLVMEYVEGRNLRQIVNELKKNNVHFSIEQIVYMIKEVAAGLDHAHRCIDGSTGRPLNITHRDMSPQNIMVSFEGEVKIIDFGIAKAETQIEATKAGTLKGKFGYMSPEQAEGQAVDLRTDIFSLGIVLWELLAYDRLFTASNEAAILRKIRDCQIPSIRKINPSVPPELERIVNKALQKDKSLRYQTSAAMHRDLNRFLNTQYPEFTPHDFSVFIKNTFVNVYQEQKRKLVDYSKIQSEDIQQATKLTQVTLQTKTADTNEDASPNAPPPPKLSANHPDNAATVVAEKPKDSRSAQVPSDTMASQIIRPETAYTPTPSQSTVNTQLSQVTRTRHTAIRREHRSESSSSMFAGIAILLFVFGGGFYVYKTQPEILGLPALQAKKTSTAPAPGAEPKAEPTAGQGEQASTIEYYYTLQSTPPGAKIYINDENTGRITPAQVRVQGKKPFKLRLEKDNYVSYEQELTPEENATSHIATLIPMPKAAYLSLTVIQGGQNPIIEINGKRLSERPPIVNYRIPAGVPVVVHARNPFTGASAEQTLVVESNQKKSIELILKINDKVSQ